MTVSGRRSTGNATLGEAGLAARMLLVAHAPTPATWRAAFPDDEPCSDLPEPAGVRSVQVLVGPELRCRQTAAALGWDGAVVPGLADLDAGRWRSRSLDSLAADEPDSLSAWLTDPSAAPHGGQSLGELVTRVGGVLDGLSWPDGRSVLVVAPLVVRAALVHLLRAPVSLIFGFDVGPLTAVTVSGHGGRWVLQSMLPWRVWGRPTHS